MKFHTKAKPMAGRTAVDVVKHCYTRVNAAHVIDIDQSREISTSYADELLSSLTYLCTQDKSVWMKWFHSRIKKASKWTTTLYMIPQFGFPTSQLEELSLAGRRVGSLDAQCGSSWATNDKQTRMSPFVTTTAYSCYGLVWWWWLVSTIQLVSMCHCPIYHQCSLFSGWLRENKNLMNMDGILSSMNIW